MSEGFGVLPDTGFLPRELPLEKLPQDYYAPWEKLMENLPALILTKRLRQMVDKIEELSASHLENEREQRRAYQVLGFLSHAYIWGTDEPTNKLPACLADPWKKVSADLGLPPVGTYAGLCLWNFKQIIPTNDPEKMWDLDNFTTINTFTGSIDESWFYLVSVYFEHAGSHTIQKGLEAVKCSQQKKPEQLIIALQNLAESIDHLGSVMMRMEEMCDPHVFYFRIRPYLAGWKNMADVGLDKDGIFYGEDPIPAAYSGGSNAQSSLIQFLDILLGVVHYPTGERPISGTASDTSKPSTSSNFMNEMREYMPRQHREFLLWLQETSHIRDYVLENEDVPGLILSYDACLSMLKLFRDKHIRIVTRYVIIPAKKANTLGVTAKSRSGLAKSKAEGVEEKGTGGTSLLPFLKQCRDETGDPAAGSWGKRILSDGMMKLNSAKDDTVEA